MAYIQLASSHQKFLVYLIIFAFKLKSICLSVHPYDYEEFIVDLKETYHNPPPPFFLSEIQKRNSNIFFPNNNMTKTSH